MRSNFGLIGLAAELGSPPDITKVSSHFYTGPESAEALMPNIDQYKALEVANTDIYLPSHFALTLPADKTTEVTKILLDGDIVRPGLKLRGLPSTTWLDWHHNESSGALDMFLGSEEVEHHMYLVGAVIKVLRANEVVTRGR